MEPASTPQQEVPIAHKLVFSIGFAAVLSAVGFISLVAADKAVSVSENRRLTPVPQLTILSLFRGTYTDSLDLYYSDNFPRRESMVQFASTIRDWAGYHTEIVYYDARPVEPEVVSAVDTTTSVKDTVARPVKDSVAVVKEYDRSSGVIVYEGRAIQTFTASREAWKKYAEMVNLYRTSFDSVKIHCLIAPTPTDFYLPMGYKNSANIEKTVVYGIRDGLDSLVNFADAYAQLEKHTREYIFFNTDHHWTGLGAYYAYRAFCESAGLTAFEMSSLERKRVRRKFLGSLYGITLDPTLKQSRDSVEYFKLPVETKTYRYNKDSARYEKSGLYSGTANYANFIGGDHPMVRIESSATGPKILVIKDSFGNAVAPLLALHYGTVYVMDYRYFNINVADFVKENGITDILFLHNTFAANAKYTSYRGRVLLGSQTNKVAQDTTRTK